MVDNQNPAEPEIGDQNPAEPVIGDQDLGEPGLSQSPVWERGLLFARDSGEMDEPVYLIPWPRPDALLQGVVVDLHGDPLPDALLRVLGRELRTGVDGSFELDVADLLSEGRPEFLEFEIQKDGDSARLQVETDAFLFRHRPYHPEADSMAGVLRTRLSLDGMWQARHADAPVSANRPYQVPGEMELQGFDMEAGREYVLTRQVDIPSDWAGRRIYLRLEAVHGRGEYFLNGDRIGESELVYTPVELEATAAARPGEANELTLRLDTGPELLADRLAASSGYAQHNPGGLHRKAYLFVLPETQLRALDMQVLVNERLDAGRVELELATEGPAREGLTLEALLRGPDGSAEPVARGRFPLEASASGQRVALSVERPQLWSAETPRLYELELVLHDAGRELERLRRPVGFRRVETRGSSLLVNGRVVKLFGVNRHEVHPRTGRADTAQYGAEDARLFKEANCNFIRTAHYPPTREFLEACDRVGLYVEVEAPFCWTHRSAEENDPAMAGAFLRPTAAMVDWHQRHASAIVWSLGNESGWQHDRPGMPACYASTHAWVAGHERSRLILFNNSWANDAGLGDIVVIHYPWPKDIERSLLHKDESRPVLIDEWLHIHCYNDKELDADPGIRELWARGITRFGRSDGLHLWHEDAMHNRIRCSERYLGISIWSGIDEVFELPGGGTAGYGPWGILDGERRCKPEWWHVRCMLAPVWLPERRADYDAATGMVSIAVENRHVFTPLDALQLRWRLGEASGVEPLPAIGPGDSGLVRWKLPEACDASDILELSFGRPGEPSVADWGLDLQPVADRVPREPSAGAPDWSMAGGRLKLRGEGFAFVVNTNDGNIEGLDGREPLLKELPRLHLTQIQRRNRFLTDEPDFELLPDVESRVLESVEASSDGAALLIRLRDRFAEFRGETRLRIDRLGVCTLDFDYEYSGAAREVNERGLRLLVDGSLQQLEWKRRGVWGMYPGDHIGRLEGVAEALPGPGADPKCWALVCDARGTRDFRSTKYGIYEAALSDGKGRGLTVESNADTNIRAGLLTGATELHLSRFEGPYAVQPGERVQERFHLRLAGE